MENTPLAISIPSVPALAAGSPVPADLQRRIFMERMTIFYAALIPSIFAVLATTLLVATILWNPAERYTICGWCVASMLVAIYRLRMMTLFRRLSEAEQESEKQTFYLQNLIGAALGGAIWGTLGVLFYDQNTPLNQSFIVYVLTGMSTGSVVTLSAFSAASVLFLVFSIAPFALRLLMIGGIEAYSMAFFSVFYLSLLIGFALRVNRILVEGLEMKFLRSRAEEAVQRQALFDELTGLPNRRLLNDRLSQAIARTKRRKVRAALLFMDLDFFKRVNDSLGHSVGDELLVEIANRMKRLLRAGDTAARLGGDEFVALLTDLDEDGEALVSLVRRRGEELRQIVERPVNIRGNEIHVTVSIGISVLDESNSSAEDLLKHADTAMYRAKDDGRNTLRFFVSDMQEALAQRLKMEQDLRSALDRREGLELYVQPQLSDQMQVCGAELLLRWNHGGRSIPPAVFISVAEDCGLIYRLGDWVVDQACAIAARLGKLELGENFSIAVNVSPQQFGQKTFTDSVLSAISREQLPPGTIELEVTEGLLIENIEDTVRKMEILRAHGVRFSIDDFGTGYSSLMYLKSLPLDSLKIDQSFVRDVLSDPGDASIVRAIVSMANTLDLEVIAEGVETREIHDFLVQAGCRKFQGFLYSRPMPIEGFEEAMSQSTHLYPSPLAPPTRP
ncbi:MAG: EAL domain-containing protein [Pseudomonadota bacterium]